MKGHVPDKKKKRKPQGQTVSQNQQPSTLVPKKALSQEDGDESDDDDEDDESDTEGEVEDTSETDTETEDEG